MHQLEAVPLTQAAVRRRILRDRLLRALGALLSALLVSPVDWGFAAGVLLLFLLSPPQRVNAGERRYHSVPATTSVTSSFDFSPETYRVRGASRTYTMRHPIFASAFMTANEGCRLDPPSKLRRAVTCVTQYAVLLAQCALVIWVIWSFTQMRMQR